MMQKGRIPILIDTDIGDDIDDAAAIIMALNSPELEILGITTVFQDTVKRAEMALELCEFCERTEIPVYVGAGRALVQKTEVRKTPIQYEILRKNRTDAVRTDRSAAEYIVELAASVPGLVIVEMGMMTNLAIAFLMNPEVMKNVRILAMGGVFTDACPEWNIVCDPEAARIVTDRAGHLEMVGLEHTKYCTLTQAELESLCPKDNQKMQYYRSGVRIFQEKLGYPVTLHDALLTAYLVNPEVLEMERCDYTIELQGSLTRGAVVREVDAYSVDTNPSKEFYYARKLHLEKFYELVQSRLY